MQLICVLLFEQILCFLLLPVMKFQSGFGLRDALDHWNQPEHSMQFPVSSGLCAALLCIPAAAPKLCALPLTPLLCPRCTTVGGVCVQVFPPSFKDDYFVPFYQNRFVCILQTCTHPQPWLSGGTAEQLPITTVCGDQTLKLLVAGCLSNEW